MYEKRSEVGIGRHHDTAFCSCPLEDGGIAGRLHAHVTYVHDVVPTCSEFQGEAG
ncbi:hypothetical protein caldi_08990 [Caldinitratiruptor microaerophilus]|uniref:Uncharacterized protein n=1 Tax=Caldinitratiruptor microaerophilus TaxID=671077 RepID=A0AA35G909_9FIRM|nr:hypothetical protein caldi_08990 [Caldinitratiruptor microaerophilus]